MSHIYPLIVVREPFPQTYDFLLVEASIENGHAVPYRPLMTDETYLFPEVRFCLRGTVWSVGMTPLRHIFFLTWLTPERVWRCPRLLTDQRRLHWSSFVDLAGLGVAPQTRLCLHTVWHSLVKADVRRYKPPPPPLRRHRADFRKR